MSNLVENLQSIYATKELIKTTLNTQSELFSEYPQIIADKIAQAGLTWDEVASYGYIVPAGAKDVYSNGDNIDVSTYRYVNVAVPGAAVLGSINIENNGNYSASTYAYDGFDSVTVNVPVPPGYIVPAGTYSITNNGNSIDISSYQYVNVAVPQGGSTYSISRVKIYAGNDWGMTNPVADLTTYDASGNFSYTFPTASYLTGMPYGGTDTLMYKMKVTIDNTEYFVNTSVFNEGDPLGNTTLNDKLNMSMNTMFGMSNLTFTGWSAQGAMTTGTWTGDLSVSLSINKDISMNGFIQNTQTVVSNYQSFTPTPTPTTGGYYVRIDPMSVSPIDIPLTETVAGSYNCQVDVSYISGQDFWIVYKENGVDSGMYKGVSENQGTPITGFTSESPYEMSMSGSYAGSLPSASANGITIFVDSMAGGFNVYGIANP